MPCLWKDLPGMSGFTATKHFQKIRGRRNYSTSHLLELPSRWWWVSAAIGWGQALPPTPRCPRCCRPERPAERDTSRRPSTVCWSRWGSHLGPPETQHTTDHDQTLNTEQADELDSSVGNTTDPGVGGRCSNSENLPRSCRAAPTLWGLLRYRRPEPSSSALLRHTHKKQNSSKCAQSKKAARLKAVLFKSLTFLVVGIYLLLLRSSPARQPGGGDEEGQQRGEEAVVGHRQHKTHQESWRRQENRQCLLIIKALCYRFQMDLFGQLWQQRCYIGGCCQPELQHLIQSHFWRHHTRDERMFCGSDWPNVL